jgi:serine/threonine-protein kinase
MATVWRGLLGGPGQFRKTVAIKHMFPNLAEQPVYREMFFEEARIGSVLQDPNLPQVYEFLVEENEHYLVMEFVDGIDLATYIRYVTQTLEQPMRWDLVAAIGIGMLRGLAAAHERVTSRGRREPIIHRDVSPNNVLISASGPAKLIDFGLSLTGDRQSEDTDPGVAKGKLPYLAPEVARGQRPTPSADQFAAGSTLWEALVGQRLFGEHDRESVYRRVAAADVPPLQAKRPDIPRDLAHLVHKALSRDPRDRFRSTREMAKLLGDVLKASTAREDLYELLSTTVKQARVDLGIGHKTQGPTDATPIPELESGLVELMVEPGKKKSGKRLLPSLLNRLTRER